MLNHYCVYTKDMRGGQFFRDLKHTGCRMDIHINRTRFWLDPSLAHHAQFYIKWSHIIHDVHPNEDPATGMVWN